MAIARTIAIWLLYLALAIATTDLSCSFASCVTRKSRRLSTKLVPEQESRALANDVESSVEFLMQLRGGTSITCSIM
jgi:hypothetical protein